MDPITNVSLSVKTALNSFGNAVKCIIMPQYNNENSPSEKKDEFTNTGAEPRSPEERTKAAVIKSNATNEQRLIAEINLSGVNGADSDNIYDKLLPQYMAYKNPEFDNMTFTAISQDSVIATHKG